MHPILDLIRSLGGDAVDNDNIIEGELPRFDGYMGRRMWIHFSVLYVPRNSYIPEWVLKRMAFKWDAGYLVGVVHTEFEFKQLVCAYRQWINSGESGFFGMFLPSALDKYKELYHPR